jgi:hypothetical protein
MPIPDHKCHIRPKPFSKSKRPIWVDHAEAHVSVRAYGTGREACCFQALLLGSVRHTRRRRRLAGILQYVLAFCSDGRLHRYHRADPMYSIAPIGAIHAERMQRGKAIPVQPFCPPIPKRLTYGPRGTDRSPVPHPPDGRIQGGQVRVGWSRVGHAPSSFPGYAPGGLRAAPVCRDNGAAGG